MSSHLHAWVDESMHAAGGPLSEGIYLLAATVANPDACDTARDSLLDLLPGRAPRLHWRDGDEHARRRMATVVSKLELTHVVVIGAPLDIRRQERARRLCMERLLYELSARGVDRVWVESRTESLNRRDLQMVDVLRSRSAIPTGLLLDFARPSAEPMLWSPDIVAGAVGLQRRAGDASPYAALSPRIVEHDIQI